MATVIDTRAETPAAALLARAVVADNHVCLPHRADPNWFARLDAHRRAGIHFASLNIGDAEVPLETQIRMAAFFRAQVRAAPDHYLWAENVADVHAAKASGRMAIALDVEGGWAMQGDVALADIYARLGVRWLAIAFNRANPFGGGIHDAEDAGLTPAGGDLLDALADAGIVACCAHTGARTARDAAAHQARRGRPLIASHANADALDPHPRNLSNALIRDIAATGGYIGLNGISIFLGRADDLVARLADHADHIAQLVGPGHVALGLDYVYDQAELEALLQASRGIWPEGQGYDPGLRYVAPGELVRLVAILLERGWREDDLIALLGGNFLGVAEAVWR